MRDRIKMYRLYGYDCSWWVYGTPLVPHLVSVSNLAMLCLSCSVYLLLACYFSVLVWDVFRNLLRHCNRYIDQKCKRITFHQAIFDNEEWEPEDSIFSDEVSSEDKAEGGALQNEGLKEVMPYFTQRRNLRQGFMSCSISHRIKIQAGNGWFEDMY